jgi:hypothetical protein
MSKKHPSLTKLIFASLKGADDRPTLIAACYTELTEISLRADVHMQILLAFRFRQRERQAGLCQGDNVFGGQKS